jgi:hypothetical protein
LVFLTIPLVLLTVLLAVVAAEVPREAGLPADVATRLDQYLASSHGTGQLSVVATSEARQPWLFGSEMSQAVLGDSVYFQTDFPLSWKTASGPSPLPFPPKELWCVLLRQGEAGLETRYALLYVALHMDMYSGDWIVHQGLEAATAAAVVRSASNVGCSLDVLDDD